MRFYTYILYSPGTDRYYIGQTNNLSGRLQYHLAGYENFTSKITDWKLVWHTEKPSRSEAIALEKKLKNLSKARLQAFISKYSS